MGDLELIELLLEIEHTPSLNDKIALLKANDSSELRKFLYFMYSYTVKFGINEKTFESEKPVQEKYMYEYPSILDIFEWLVENNTSTDIAKDKVRAFCEEFCDEHIKIQDMLKRCFLRNLRIGIDAKLVNRAIPDCVPVFDVPLATPIDKVKSWPWNHEQACYGLEPKVDGVRTIAVLGNYGVELFTRNGKEISGFTNIEMDLKFLHDIGVRGIFDGELVDKDFTGTTEVLFRKVSNKPGTYLVWDFISLDDFYNPNNAKENLNNRRINLLTLIGEYEEFLRHIEVIPSYILKNDDILGKIEYLTDMLIEEGYEGSIVKDMHSVYTPGRNKNWVKVKRFHTEDYRVVRLIEGKGKYKDMLGALVIDVDGVEVEVGSGFSDDARYILWNEKSDIIGSFVEVKYQEKIKKSGSLRFPVFVKIRQDL